MQHHRRYARTAATNKAGAQDGVTLLDLVLVALIVSILALVGVPALHSSLLGARLAAAADEVVSAVEHAQTTALAKCVRTRVSFDVAADTVLVEEAVLASSISTAPGSELSAGLIETTTFAPMENPWNPGEDYVLSPAQSAWFGQVDLTQANLGGQSWVAFDPWGRPSSGGVVKLSMAERTVTLSLDRVSGKMSAP